MRNLLLAGLGLALCACGEKTAPVAEAPKAAFGSFGIDLLAMDTSVKPGDDFYSYVNGKWVASTAIPADRAGYSIGNMVFDKTEADVHAIVDELAASKPEPSSVAGKIGVLYGGYMDEAAIEARGVEPLKPFLAQIDAARTKADLMKLVGTLDYQAPFALYFDADPKDPTKYMIWVTQAGLGMPNRDYYLNKGEKFDGYRTAYAAYVAKVFELIGDKDPAGSAKKVIALENRIAAVAWAPERRRNVKETINPMDRAGLKKLAPGIDWDVALAGVGLGDVQNVIVGEITAIRDGARLFDTVAVADWKAYMAFHFVNSYTSELPKAFDDASFDFFSKTLRGVEKQRDRWKRGVALLDVSIGEGLGEVYVKKHFPPETKAKMDELVANLRAALGERLKNNTWMDEATKAEAQKKLDGFEPRIGYTTKWRDYSALVFEPGKHFENVRAARLFDWDRQVKRINQPVDRTEWFMTPQTVDAYYDALQNQITFPAGILQPPFFDPNADPAVNYGSIGAVIGHEIGHGFDDQGREFDGEGKQRNWWTPETNAKFVEATKKLGALYHAYCPLDGACVNGDLTMGENIGDLGGLEMAYTAYKLSLGGKEAPVIDGFTGDQRFFMAHAQAWRGKIREDALRAQMLTDPHSPRVARGSFPERNMDAWYAAFGVKEGDKLFLKPEERVNIW